MQQSASNSFLNQNETFQIEGIEPSEMIQVNAYATKITHRFLYVPALLLVTHLTSAFVQPHQQRPKCSNLAFATSVSSWSNKPKKSQVSFPNVPLDDNDDETNSHGLPLHGLVQHHALPTTRTSETRNDLNACVSPLEIEFREMMDNFAHYSDSDIRSIRDPRLLPLYEGIVEGSREPAVYRAFTILYEDYIPIRIAGRMIFKRLKNVIETAIQRRDLEHETIASLTGLSPIDIATSRQAFLKMSDSQSNDGEPLLTVEGFVTKGIAATAVDLMGYCDVEEFVAIIDHDNTGKLNFEKLMNGLQCCSTVPCDSENSDVGSILPDIVKEMDCFLGNSSEQQSKRNKKCYDRYDYMVESFIEWEDIIPKGEGRVMAVLRGCFAGARHPKIVEALKILYVDYYALRVAGDLIFKLVTNIVKGQTKKKTKKEIERK